MWQNIMKMSGLWNLRTGPWARNWNFKNSNLLGPGMCTETWITLGHESLERLRLGQISLGQFREKFPWTAKYQDMRQLGTIKVLEIKPSGLAVPSYAHPWQSLTKLWRPFSRNGPVGFEFAWIQLLVCYCLFCKWYTKNYKNFSSYHWYDIT